MVPSHAVWTRNYTENTPHPKKKKSKRNDRREHLMLVLGLLGRADARARERDGRAGPAAYVLGTPNPRAIRMRQRRLDAK